MPDKNTPLNADPVYDSMLPYLQRAEDLTEGIEAMRSGGYLHQRYLESPAQFAIRQAEAVLLPAFSDAVEKAVGLVFRQDAVLGEDVPPVIRGIDASAKEGLAENIDNAGTHINVFLKECFDTAVRYGHCAIIVESPPALPAGSSLADERAAARRPYWIRHAPQTIRHAQCAIENGRKVLNSITFIETSNEAISPFEVREVVSFRVYRREAGLVVWELWEEVDMVEGGQKKKQAVVVDGGVINLPEIPVAVIYGRKIGELESRPPYQHLIDQNIAHYCGDSDYRQFVSYNQFPLLALIGRNNPDALVPSGAAGIIDIPLGGDAKFLSPEGEGASIGRNAQQDLEKLMEQSSAAILSNQEDLGNKTATQSNHEHAGRTSKLSGMVKSLQDAAERALGFTAAYLNLPSGGSIIIGGEVEEDALTATDLAQLTAARANGLPLSEESLHALLRKAGFTELELADELLKLAEERSREVLTDREPVSAEEEAADDPGQV